VGEIIHILGVDLPQMEQGTKKKEDVSKSMVKMTKYWKRRTTNVILSYLIVLM
jgi:hypothetical protein